MARGQSVLGRDLRASGELGRRSSPFAFGELMKIAICCRLSLVLAPFSLTIGSGIAEAQQASGASSAVSAPPHGDDHGAPQPVATLAVATPAVATAPRVPTTP